MEGALRTAEAARAAAAKAEAALGEASRLLADAEGRAREKGAEREKLEINAQQTFASAQRSHQVPQLARII